MVATWPIRNKLSSAVNRFFISPGYFFKDLGVDAWVAYDDAHHLVETKEEPEVSENEPEGAEGVKGAETTDLEGQRAPSYKEDWGES